MTTPVTTEHLESRLEGFFLRQVRAYGGYTTKITSMEKGLPDRLVLFPGGHIFVVELKAEGGRVDPLQVVWHERAAALGVHVPVLSGHVEVTRWLARVADDLGLEKQSARDGSGRVDLSDAGEM